jgi:predicted nucleotidyltransferase
MHKYEIVLWSRQSALTVHIIAKSSVSARSKARYWEINGYKIRTVDRIESDVKVKVDRDDRTQLIKLMHERQKLQDKLTCRTCGETKCKVCFYDSPTMKTGYTFDCKNCVKLKRREYLRKYKNKKQFYEESL